MKLLSLLALTLIALAFPSCEEEQPVQETQEVSLVEIKDGVYTEYYPGRKAIKYRGPQDENGLRDGMWYFYSESGVEMSMTEYSHGKKHGDSFVRYPNGVMRYYGRYENDQQVGVWVTYDQNGKVEQEKDFGTPLE